MDRRSGLVLLAAAYIALALGVWPDQAAWIIGMPAVLAVTAWALWSLFAGGGVNR